MHTFSASQINTFMAEPQLWVIQSLFKMKSPQNGWAIKGTVFGDYVEEGALTGNWDRKPEEIKKVIADACDSAGVEVPSLSSLDVDWQNAKEHFQRWENIFGKPVATQEEFVIDTKHGKLRGFIDVRYNSFCADIKNRTKIERDFKQSDKIQMACYWKAKGCAQWLLEFSAGRKRVHPFGNELLEWWSVAEHNMGRMNKIIADMDNIKTANPGIDDKILLISLLRLLPIHNWDGYWWPSARELSLEARR